MATVSSAGIGSGLDVSSIISQLMAIESQPKTQLVADATKTQTQISEVGKITSAISNLRDLSTKLASSTFWQQTTASSSSSAVSVTSTSTATPATYSVNVSQLASAQSLVAGQTFASSSAAVGSGTLTLALGSWNTGQTAFTPQSPASTLDIAIDDSDTVASLRDKINSSGAGVTASLLTDSSGVRLVLSSKSSGAANGFAVSVANGTGALSSLAYPPTGTKSATLAAAAADANATINGLAVSSPTNTLSNVLDGVSMTLNAVTTTTTGAAPVNVNVVADTASIKKTLQDFATAYSSIVTTIATDTKYDATTKKAGPLQGDSAVVGVLSRLRGVLGASSTASSAFAHLSDAGFEQQRDGTLTVNAAKLDNALSNLPQLKAMFSNASPSDPSASGFAKRFQALADSLINVDGTLTARKDGLNTKLQRNQKSQDAMDQRLAQTQARLTAQYSALDTTVSSANALSSYVTQQITQWNKSS